MGMLITPRANIVARGVFAIGCFKQATATCQL